MDKLSGAGGLAEVGDDGFGELRIRDQHHVVVER